MKTQNHPWGTGVCALPYLGGLLLALLLIFVAAPLLSDAQVLAAPGVAQGGASVTNRPLETCTLISTTRTCELWATTGTLTMPTTVTVPVWGFTDVAGGAAQVPGPAIVANAGETLEIIFHNDLLTETVSLTFPGQMGLLPDLDGIPAGGTITYTFDLAAPGTYLYEAGMTPNGSRQVAMGLYGALVVRPAGAPGQAYNDPATAFQDEALLVLGAIDPLFNAGPNNYEVQFFKPEYWLINGLAYPDTLAIDTIAGNTLLLRYVNATHETQGMSVLGLRQLVIGNDGYPVVPYGVVAETIAAGQSMDMLVSVPPGTTTGAKFALYNASLMNHNASARTPGGNLAYGGMMTFINTVTGAPLWEPGPVTKNVHVTPSPTTGDGGVTLTADIIAAAGHTVTAAEYFTDTLGTPGSGIPIPVTAGAQVAVSVALSPAELASWPGGYPIFYVRGVDEIGHWGVPGAAVLNLDKVGPDVISLNLSHDPTNGTVAVTLIGTGDDRWNGRGNVVAAQYIIAGLPAETMTLNLTGSPIVEISAVISTSVLSTLPEANYPIEVTAQDALGNWGASSFITLTLDKTGPAAPIVTLTPDALDLTQPVTVTKIRLDADISDASSGGVRSALANAEAFVDVVGLPGEGFDLFPVDGLFDEPDEAVYFDMPLAHFMMLPEGTHTVFVRGVDVAGNWGAFGEATIFIDRGGVAPGDVTGPNTTAATATPNPTNGAAQVTLTATATDPGSESNIAAGEWFVGPDPGPGNGFAMSAADGAFDSPVEGLTAAVNVSGWPNGNYFISIRALDSSGNWGSAVQFLLFVRGNTAINIFQDTFDDGTLDAWTAAVGGVAVTPDAALPATSGGSGLAATLGADPAYVQHSMPPGEISYRASFYYAPNGAAMGDAHHDIFLGLDRGTPLFGIQVEESGDTAGQYEVRAWVLASGVPVYTAWHDISGAPRLGIQWRVSNDAGFALLIDGVVVEELNGLDTGGHLLYEVRLGPSTNLDPALSGVEYFDVFQATRT
ncbi:MAG TPA: multicopper oxidase domain-containing protein, partial [Anaerolineae bacterium]|nr:multicopper oxidase domain-containing protein [Anaerolineae bacterium]